METFRLSRSSLPFDQLSNEFKRLRLLVGKVVNNAGHVRHCLHLQKLICRYYQGIAKMKKFKEFCSVEGTF